jgi:hypothetical protein
MAASVLPCAAVRTDDPEQALELRVGEHGLHGQEDPRCGGPRQAPGDLD